MKQIKFYVRENERDFEISLSFNRDVQKEIILRDKNILLEKVKKQYPKADLIELLIPTTPKINKDRLMRIGDDIASLWGAVCTGVKTYENIVVFECKEYGEKFTTTMTYSEINKEYSYIN